jgi:hypothetical protein
MLGIPLAQRALNGKASTRVFSLPPGVTVPALLDQIEIVYADLHDEEFYAMEFDPAEPKNPRPGRFSVVFNTGVGNPNIPGGPREAANTIVHELIHVAYGKYGARAVAGAVRQGWINDDGGDDPASEAAQETNDRIVELDTQDLGRSVKTIPGLNFAEPSR